MTTPEALAVSDVRAAPETLEVPAHADPHGPGSGTAPASVARPGRWIDHWEPEDPTFWSTVGRRVARRNLYPSIFAEFLGFSVWASWSIVVPQLAAAGFALTVDQQFWLIAIPSLVGATLRVPYTFAVPRFGGRNWTITSALLLLVSEGVRPTVIEELSRYEGRVLYCTFPDAVREEFLGWLNSNNTP